MFGEEMEMAQLISNYISYFQGFGFNTYLSLITFSLLLFITFSVAYISYVDFKDKRRK
ncbi:Hypothetical protein P9211_08421 [Prochlorococcus marinus str. MIT 9211]|uniref:Uncharacterized protein n=1 Tax=Prochlorococcus marinus (strain MIT 9211) TaxID=93059 RepID=A9BAB1_PROM4|nr:Hypothetical protein P9211_08421 [Prochlorococcus marinus str. MIT 9211]